MPTSSTIAAILAMALSWNTAAPAVAQDPVESLLRLHHEQRVAHVLGDAERLVARFAEPLTEVSRGAVRTVTREEARSRFGAYFDAVRFLEWEDAGPPRIRLSSDGRWAEVVVRKRVRTVPAEGAGPADAWRFAWVERWAREAGEEGEAGEAGEAGDEESAWRLHTMVSTERRISSAVSSGADDPESADPPAADDSDPADPSTADPGDNASADAPPAHPGASARAYEILARARAALGGEEAVAAVATLRFAAECSGPGGAFTTRVASARDGRVSFRQETEDGAFGMGIDLAGAWAGADGSRVDSLGAVESSVVAAHELHLLAIAPESRYVDPRALGRERVDGRVVDVVAFTDALGARVPFYYDGATGRPVGFRPVNHTGRGDAEILTLFDDWRPVGDVLLPHAIRIEQGEDVYRYRVTELSTDWLPDRAFGGGAVADRGPGRGLP